MIKVPINFHDLAALMTAAVIKPSMSGKSDLPDIALIETIVRQLQFEVLSRCS